MKREENKQARQTDLHVLCGLAVVLEDDGDVHVHDDQETKTKQNQHREELKGLYWISGHIMSSNSIPNIYIAL